MGQVIMKNLIVDDHPLFRAGFQAVLEQSPLQAGSCTLRRDQFVLYIGLYGFDLSLSDVAVSAAVAGPDPDHVAFVDREGGDDGVLLTTCRRCGSPPRRSGRPRARPPLTTGGACCGCTRT